MENASKFLLIAGVMLIAILVISLGTYTINIFKNPAESYSNNLDSIELQKYNSNFTSFIGRNDVTAQEIISLVGLAKQLEQNTKIFVKTNISTSYDDITDYSDVDKKEFLKNCSVTYKKTNTSSGFYKDAKNYFSCQGIDYYNNGIVKQLKFEEL